MDDVGRCVSEVYICPGEFHNNGDTGSPWSACPGTQDQDDENVAQEHDSLYKKLLLE